MEPSCGRPLPNAQPSHLQRESNKSEFCFEEALDSYKHAHHASQRGVISLQAWDLAAEMCLLQLPALLGGEPDQAEFRPSPFFAEQLTAFELWLAHGSALKQPPEQLPIVLQVRA